MCTYSNMEILYLFNTTKFTQSMPFAAPASIFYDNKYLKKIIGKFTFTSAPTTGSFSNCYSLEEIKLSGLKFSVEIKYSQLLTLNSILYIINNVDTSATNIVVTLHSTVYSKCTTGGDWYNDVSSALSNHSNITLASA